MDNKELEMAKEIVKIVQENNVSVQELIEEYKKAQSLATKQGKEHLKNNITDILTDKVDIDNYGVYDKNGQTLMGVDEI
ncbi:hypothetical protein [Clostridium tertium]|uniref:hypothetical protein n=1 Tax=Clostridium tertium TaxID=1559 RepID=UPI0018A9C1F8|nr:hypothetical protein [Clostridium tertium]MDB1969444.1 hypothetical protein [Clostridium tertium]